MAGPRSLRVLARSLRFRLTLSYVLFFTFLLAVVGVLFHRTLVSVLEGQAHAVLEEEWGAVRGYLRIERGVPIWFYDDEDPEETFIVERLKRVFLLADASGRILECSNGYRAIGADSPEQIRAAVRAKVAAWHTRDGPQGVPYLIRAGVLVDEGREYFIAIGRSLGDNRHIVEEATWSYVVLMPVMILSSCLLGWFLAGRALRPVNDVSKAAQRISGANLSYRIPSLGSGDELDHLVATFNRMTEGLERSFEQIRRFSIDVSHELRTPITAIQGQLEVALLTGRTTEHYREAVLNALQDVERLSHLVRSLLLLAQAESGQLVLQRERLDLAALAREVLDQFEVMAEPAGVRLSADLAPGCAILADRVQVERLLSNLLSNAVKYTAAGGEVRVRLASDGAWAELTVEDTGCGIPAEHLPHIYDRFYRIPKPDGRPGEGLGLGLSFVSWIVKAHGGTISVRSEVGKGSCFTVRLPSAGSGAPAA